MQRQLFRQFNQLKHAISVFLRSVEESTTVLWLADWHAPRLSSLEAALTDLWYHEDQDGRITRVYPGLVGLSREQMTLAHEINQSKDRFKIAVNAIKEADPNRWREAQHLLAKRHHMINEQLLREGLNRLHLKQLFRHIPLVVSRPDKVGFSWYTSGRSIKKVSKSTAYDLLCRLNTEASHIKLQLQRLSHLPINEKLARVQTQAPVLRANMVFAGNRRRSMNVSLPLMFPSEGKTQLPIFNIPQPQPPKTRNRLQRSDNLIEPEPYLPSIRVHRYHANKKGVYY